MADLIVQLTNTPDIVVVQDNDVTSVGSSSYNPPSMRLEDMQNVDSAARSHGSVLVYKTTTSKWTSTTTLDAQNVDAGEF